MADGNDLSAAYTAFVFRVIWGYRDAGGQIDTTELDAVLKEMATLEARQAELRIARSRLTRHLVEGLPEVWRDLARSFWVKLERRRTQREATRLRRTEAARRSVGAFTVADFAALVEEYGGLCLRCWTPGEEDDPLVPDHVQPLALGGKDAIDNIQPLHRSCNQKKGAEWIDYRDDARKRLAAHD